MENNIENKDKIIRELKEQVSALQNIINLNKKEKDLIIKEHNITVKSLKSDIENLKNDKSYVSISAAAEQKEEVTKKEFSNMTYEERLDIFNNNKELYNFLVAK